VCRSRPKTLTSSGSMGSHVVVASYAINDVGVFEGNGKGGFRPPIAYGSGGARGLCVADLNGDGAPDILTANGGWSDSVSVVFNLDRAPRFWALGE
jgi:hypothetical protein